MVDKNKYYSYKELKNLVRKFKFKSQSDYQKRYKILNNELLAPINPRTFYGLNTWEGWAEFLGNENIRKKLYGLSCSYNEYKKIIQKYNIKTKTEFFKKINKISKNNPSLVRSPRVFYKDEWETWGIFLGTNNTHTNEREYLPFEKAREWARSLNFKMVKEWKKMNKTDIPINIPRTPNFVYKNKGWIDWCDFLGVDKKLKMSYGEKKINDYLIKHNINFKFDKPIKGCKNECLLRFDFQIPSKNICIEYDGEQHFKPKKYYGGETEFKKVKLRDKIKNTFCEEQNIKLIRIPYTLSEIEIIETLNKEIKNDTANP